MARPILSILIGLFIHLPVIGKTMAESKTGVIIINVNGLRNAKGKLAVSIFSKDQISAFPAGADKAIQTFYVDVVNKAPHQIQTNPLPHGEYAVALMHDENSNGKFDTVLGIPTEGFGFSNNPLVLLGPPRYQACSFSLNEAEYQTSIQLKYIL